MTARVDEPARADEASGHGWGGLITAPLWRVALLAGVSYGLLGLVIEEVTSFGTSVGATFWPGAGVSVAFLLRLRTRQWPAVLLAVGTAELAVDLWNGFGWALGLGWAVANAGEACFGAWLFRRDGRISAPLQDIRVLLRFVATCVLAGPALGATVGTVWASAVTGDPLWPRLPRWFVGDAIGVLVVAPVLLGMRGRGLGAPVMRHRVWSFLGLAVVCVVGLGPWEFVADWGLPFVVLAFLVLFSVWQGHASAAAGLLGVAGVVEITTALDVGPFAENGALHGLVMAEMFVAACAFTALLVAALTSDLVTREELERVLRTQALHDELTGLPNRRLFEERFAQAAARAQRSGESVAVAVIDLDGFKGTNDRYGHAAGDAVLAEAARRMLTHVREQDTVARLGGDEFGVLLDGVDDATQVDRMVTRLTLELDRPLAWQGCTLPLTASVGVAVSGREGADLESLTTAADRDMYRAKGLRAGAAPWVHTGAMARTDSTDADPFADEPSDEQDPITALHDTQEEGGDESAVTDSLTLDEREAREVGVDLDPVEEDEPRLD